MLARSDYPKVFIFLGFIKLKRYCFLGVEGGGS